MTFLVTPYTACTHDGSRLSLRLIRLSERREQCRRNVGLWNRLQGYDRAIDALKLRLI